MSEIGIYIFSHEFEQDFYELIKAFYPGEEIRVHEMDRAEKATGGEEIIFRSSADEKSFILEGESPDGKECVHVSRITGQSSPEGGEALLSCDEKMRYDLKRQNKDAFKLGLYGLLKSMTKKDLPWGALTGIRPAKLAMGMLEAGMRNTEIAACLREDYLVSPKKCALAITIANRERDILSKFDYKKGYSLYLGIPFCPSICAYCSFSSSPIGLWQKRVEDYLTQLFYEIAETAKIMKETGKKLQTVYIGGGTPTSLSADQLRRLFCALEESFEMDGLVEYTLEAGRPDSISRDKLLAAKEAGIGRISVNPQTLNDETLQIIGRRHSAAQALEAYSLSRETGFDNINMDIIVGLPGEDEGMVEKTLSGIERLSPDSLTVHSLAVKRAARLNLFKDQFEEMGFENNQKIIDLTMQSAMRMQMGPYYMYRQKNMKGNLENVGYAKEGKACIYNILIMEEKQSIIGLGAGSSTKLVYEDRDLVKRVENVKDVKNYLERTREMIERKREAVSEWAGE